MKNLLLLAITLPLLLGGCGEKHEGVNWEELEISGDIFNEIAYHKGSPYTGKSYKLHPNGQKYTETNYKDGKEDGLDVMWFENGQKAMEVNWKNGKQDGLLTTWHEDGQKWIKENYKDGEKVSAKYWNSKGEPVDSLEEAKK